MKSSVKKAIIVSMVVLAAGMAFAAINEKEAIEIALQDAGVTREEASWLRAHEDRDDGLRYFDVEFRTDEGEWDYEIDSESGNIIGFDFEKFRTAAPAASFDRPQAEEIALADAGLSREEASRMRVETDRDHHRIVYEIEFFGEDAEYDYEIDDNGIILKASWEKRGRIAGDRDARLSENEAEEIARKALSSDADNLSVWEDFDDGRFWYEAKAVIGDYVYEVDITGSGDVNSISREYIEYRR